MPMLYTESKNFPLQSRFQYIKVNLLGYNAKIYIKCDMENVVFASIHQVQISNKPEHGMNKKNL